MLHVMFFFFDQELIQPQQFICFVCIQQFKDANHLSKHQTESLLHQVCEKKKIF
jgi:hypothetical protein